MTAEEALVLRSGELAGIVAQVARGWFARNLLVVVDGKLFDNDDPSASILPAEHWELALEAIGNAVVAEVRKRSSTRIVQLLIREALMIGMEGVGSDAPDDAKEQNLRGFIFDYARSRGIVLEDGDVDDEIRAVVQGLQKAVRR